MSAGYIDEPFLEEPTARRSTGGLLRRYSKPVCSRLHQRRSCGVFITPSLALIDVPLSRSTLNSLTGVAQGVRWALPAFVFLPEFEAAIADRRASL